MGGRRGRRSRRLRCRPPRGSTREASAVSRRSARRGVREARRRSAPCRLRQSRGAGTRESLPWVSAGTGRPPRGAENSSSRMRSLPSVSSWLRTRAAPAPTRAVPAGAASVAGLASKPKSSKNERERSRSATTISTRSTARARGGVSATTGAGSPAWAREAPSPNSVAASTAQRKRGDDMPPLRSRAGRVTAPGRWESRASAPVEASLRSSGSSP